jgi:hypothetical protein
VALLSILGSRAQHDQSSLDVPLTDASKLSIKGLHRFIEIQGIKGLLVTSLRTKAFLETSLLNSGCASTNESLGDAVPQFPYLY